jgi:hypothetical protein
MTARPRLNGSPLRLLERCITRDFLRLFDFQTNGTA